MMDGIDEAADLLTENNGPHHIKSEPVDLTDTSLVVDISDALSEKDKVKFTVQTKTTLPEFRQCKFSVVRQHEEFVWLHDRYEENENYGGIVIPPAPPKPDFDASREKLQHLGEGENTMTKEEFTKMKQELEAEYLATFKKTVAMHEVFLQRIAAHPLLRNDVNFKVFLEYDQDLSVRGKNRKERLSGFFKNVTQSADEVLLTNQKDVDDFFDQQKTFIVEYHEKIKDCCFKADRMTRSHKNVSDSYIKISAELVQLATVENSGVTQTKPWLSDPLTRAFEDLGDDQSSGTQDSSAVAHYNDLRQQAHLWAQSRILNKLSEGLERARKSEGRVASDEDLKLSDTLRYYVRDTTAAKKLLYRRARALANYEAANKNLDKARAKNKEVKAAEDTQQEMCQKFDSLSETARSELKDFRVRRINHFRKNMSELADLEIKHARSQVQLLKSLIISLKED